ncbi:ADP-ribosyltransferase [Acinetobacter baumannii]
MLEYLSESQLNEAFESNDKEYDAVDLWPATKTPQCFLIRGPGIKNVVVRLGALVDGTKVRNLQPNDKDVAIFVMSMSEKGNLTELKGGLGSNPLKALVAIFDTVIGALSLTKVETILFRFPLKSLGGQGNGVKRIIDRLIMSRARGRFVTFDELVPYSKKFAFIMAHKKSIDISDLPGAEIDSDQFKKVDTKVGEVYIDNDTGKEVSKSFAVADSIGKKLDKITTASVISKTKISRRAIMSALYSPVLFDTKRKPEYEEMFQNYSNSNSVHAAGDKKSTVQKVVSSVDLKTLGATLSEVKIKKRGDVDQNTFRLYDALEFHLSSNFGIKSTSSEGKTIINTVINDIGKMVERANPKDMQSTLVDIAEYIGGSTIFGDIDKDERVHVLRSVMQAILKGPIGQSIIEAYKSPEGVKEAHYQYTEDQIKAIEAYTGSSYANINDYLIGNSASIDSNSRKTIDNLDDAFANGSTLDRGTVLYRGQKVKIGQLMPMIDNKILYFKNFVSTSLFPLIFGGFANASANIDLGAQDQTDFTSADLIKSTSIADYNRSDTQDPSYADVITVSVAMVIKGANKIKVIVPGGTSSYPDECEVILPRGTAMKIVKVTGETQDGDSKESMLMETDIISADQLDESSDVYDGDLFLSEGKLEKIKSFNLSNLYTNEVLREAAVPDNPVAAELLAKMVNFDEISPKFYE